MKTIRLKCNTCNESFDKPINEYNRRVKLGKTKHYCSLSCFGKSKKNLDRIVEVGKSYYFKGGENKLITDKQLLLSSMKEFTRRIRRRKSNFISEVLPDTLSIIWNNQNGKCVYTGVDLVLPHDSNYKLVSNNFKASIDRIDSSKPYSIDNIQFTSLTVNLAKSTMSNSELLEFFEIINNMGHTGI